MLIYFDERDGRPLALDRERIVGMLGNRLPSETPTRVLIDCAPGHFDVRGSFDHNTEKLAAHDMLHKEAGNG